MNKSGGRDIRVRRRQGRSPWGEATENGRAAREDARWRSVVLDDPSTVSVMFHVIGYDRRRTVGSGGWAAKKVARMAR